MKKKKKYICSFSTVKLTWNTNFALLKYFKIKLFNENNNFINKQVSRYITHAGRQTQTRYIQICGMNKDRFLFNDNL